jgi:hypothetical protein
MVILRFKSQILSTRKYRAINEMIPVNGPNIPPSNKREKKPTIIMPTITIQVCRKVELEFVDLE